MKRMTHILLACFVFVVILVGEGGTKDLHGHRDDWEEAFGFEPDQASLDRLWSEAREVLDRWQDAYAEIKRRFPWFDWGEYRHRLLFHWGFNEAPARHEPLIRQVEISYANYVRKIRDTIQRKPDATPEGLIAEIPLLKAVPHELLQDLSPAGRMAIWAELESSVKKEQFSAFWSFLRAEQGRRTSNPESSDGSRRNRELIRSVESNLGLSGRPARAMATLIYDIHVLSDYTTPDKAALADLSRLKDDIANLGVRRLVGPDTWARCKPMFDRLQFYRNDHSEAHATQLLDLLKQILPEIMNTSPYRELLNKKGIKLRNSQQSMKEAA